MKDLRPEALNLFNKEFVDVPLPMREVAIGSRLPFQTEDIDKAWGVGQWHMSLTPLVGPTAIIVGEEDFMRCLPHLGSAKVAYNAKKNWVCRQYGFIFASIVSAALECNVGIICDFDGHHFYSFVPVHNNHKIKILIIEPQSDTVVYHTDPKHHYTGDRAGFAILI